MPRAGLRRHTSECDGGVDLLRAGADVGRFEMSRINFARRLEIANDLASGRMDVAKDGGFFCQDCQLVTVLDEDREQMACAMCQGVRTKTLDPVPHAPARVRRAKPNDKGQKLRVVPPNEGHARFEAMKASLA